MAFPAVSLDVVEKMDSGGGAGEGLPQSRRCLYFSRLWKVDFRDFIWLLIWPLFGRTRDEVFPLHGRVKRKREIYECARVVSDHKEGERNCATIPAITQTVKGEVQGWDWRAEGEERAPECPNEKRWVPLRENVMQFAACRCH